MSVRAFDPPAGAAPDAALTAMARQLATQDFLAHIVRQRHAGRTALVSSFGTEAAVLLHMVAAIDRTTPVIFLDTGKLFGETLRYRDHLMRRLGLTDLRTIEPDERRIAEIDCAGDLWRRDANACCALRKVEPLQRALTPFAAWINGRKRFQGGARAALPVVEMAQGRVKINPLANWTAGDIERYFAAYRLPRHPLQQDGYTSVGCTPCTDRTMAGENSRAGRWRGQSKTECGIHLPPAEPAVPVRPHTGC